MMCPKKMHVKIEVLYINNLTVINLFYECKLKNTICVESKS